MPLEMKLASQQTSSLLSLKYSLITLLTVMSLKNWITESFVVSYTNKIRLTN
nr:MAG TPA: hypothetical protein [Caudoviricetes sp.]